MQGPGDIVGQAFTSHFRIERIILIAAWLLQPLSNLFGPSAQGSDRAIAIAIGFRNSILDGFHLGSAHLRPPPDSRPKPLRMIHADLHD